MEECESLVHDDGYGERVEEKAGMQPSDSADAGSEEETNTANMAGEESKFKQNVAEIGGSKKRKQGKVVGEMNVGEIDETHERSPSARKPRQKKKKVKLSFDETEES
jgi:Domain of unknown function (DUF4604)